MVFTYLTFKNQIQNLRRKISVKLLLQKLDESLFLLQICIPMKAKITGYVFLITLLMSCARAVTPNEAANRTFKKCHPMK